MVLEAEGDGHESHGDVGLFMKIASGWFSRDLGLFFHSEKIAISNTLSSQKEYRTYSDPTCYSMSEFQPQEMFAD